MQPTYDDLPPWHPDDNFDNVRKRTINAAWHLLITRDISDVRFADLAAISEVKAPAIYYYFKDHAALAADLAVRSMIKLRFEYNAALGKTKSASRCIRALLQFAHRRPHHMELITSARFAAHPKVAEYREVVFRDFDGILWRLFRRNHTLEERIALRVQVFGGATLVAARLATVEQVLTTLMATLKKWRRTTRPRKAA